MEIEAPMETMQRHLDRIEEVFKKINMGLLPIGTEYRGEIDADILGSAFRRLCITHPVLRAQIAQDDDRYLLRVPDAFCPDIAISDGDVSTIFRECISAERQADGRTMQPILVRSRDDPNHHGYVAMGIDHSIIDAASVYQYFRELWQLYTDLQNGRSIDPEPKASLPRSPHELLIENWPVYADEFDEKVKNETNTGRAESAGGENNATTNYKPRPVGNVETVYLSSEETSGILETCKLNKISVGSFLGAALATTLRSYNDNEGPITVRFNVRTDARNRIANIGSTETTFIVVDIPAEIDVKLEDDLLVTSSRLQEEIKDITHNLSAKTGLKHDETEDLDIVLNNAGCISTFVNPKGIEILEIVSSHMRIRESIERSGDESLLRELHRRTLCLKQHQRCTMTSLTYNGKLRIRFKMREDVPSSSIEDFKSRILNIGHLRSTPK